MAEELVMPRLSDTMERGTVARWLKHEGDAVQPGDVVAEIETDKATMEYQSDLEGVLLRILVGDGESADLGAPIALVGDPAETPTAGDGQAAQPPVEEPGTEEREPAAEPDADQPSGRQASTSTVSPTEEPSVLHGGPSRSTVKASPVARRMADEAGIDLRQLANHGSGPDGRIVRHDVERLLEQRDQERAAPPDRLPGTVVQAGETVEPSRMQRVIAQRMAEAKSTVPHFYLTVDVDMGRAMEIRAELNSLLQPEGVKVSVNDLVIRACGLALATEHQFHRSWIDNRLVYHAHANVGLAVALDDGLIVPVVRNVEQKPLRQVAVEASDLADRARNGGLKQPEIEGATFTVSNLGMFGVASFAAIINPPEPGILAVGATSDRAVVRDGSVLVRPIMQMTLSVDHRATSGADAARFLASVKRLLEAPLLLLG